VNIAKIYSKILRGDTPQTTLDILNLKVRDDHPS